MSSEPAGYLLDIFNKLTQEQLTHRGAGFAELLNVLRNPKFNVKELKDKAWHRMFEAIFSGAIKEKAAWITKKQGGKGAGPGALTSAEKRIQKVGYALRLAVERGVGSLQAKTVKALYEHIPDMLRTQDGDLFEGLSHDYLKALRTCLQHGSHTEHVSPNKWRELAEFLCQSLEIKLGRKPEENDQDDAATPNSLTSSSMRSGAGSQAGSKLGIDGEELVFCLRLLLSATTAPVQENAEFISDVLLKFLSSQRDVTRAHQSAFAALNSILDAVVTNNISLCANISERIIPSIDRLWKTKMPGVKEEMVISLAFCEPHLRRLTRNPDAIVRRAMENLLETMDYSDRIDKDMLQVDDIDFTDPLKPPDRDVDPLSLRAFGLKKNLSSPRREKAWMVPELISGMIEMLDDAVDGSKTAERTENRAKRQRINKRSEEIVRNIRMSPSKRLYGLQVLCFLADKNGLDGTEGGFDLLIRSLQDACISADDGTVARSGLTDDVRSWALLALACCAFMKPASAPHVVPLWEYTWKLCTRYITTQQTCRAACHLMRVLLARNLEYTRISESIDTMIQSDLSAPAALVDSALALWCLVLRRRNSVAHSSRLPPGERLFEWFILKWQPEDALNKSSAASYTHHTAPVLVSEFLFACCGMNPVDVTTYPRRICGPMAQARIRLNHYKRLLAFLLHEDDFEEIDVQRAGPDVPIQVDELGSYDPELHAKILEKIENQATLVHERWKHIVSAQTQHITVEVVYNFSGFICTASLLCSVEGARSSLDETLRNTLIPELTNHLNQSDPKYQITDGLLLNLSDLMPKPLELVQHEPPPSFRGPITVLLRRCVQLLTEGKQYFESTSTNSNEDDPMDVDDDFSIVEHRKESTLDGNVLREGVRMESSEHAFRQCTAAHLCFMDLRLGAPDNQTAYTEFIGYLTKLPAESLIASKPVVYDFFSATSSKLSDNKIDGILEHLGKILGSYDYESCETSIDLAICVLNALVSRWVPSPSDMAEEVFYFVSRICLDKKLTSYALRLSMVTLLQSIISHNPEFRSDLSKKSAREYLIKTLLHDEDTRVLYGVAHGLGTLFTALGNTTPHETYEDIEEHIPGTYSNGDWKEGLAMRVYIFSLVPEKTHSVNWRVVYRIFETAKGNDSTEYVAHGLLVVSRLLKLNTPRNLFNLFRRELLSTWLDHHQNHDFSTFPFRVFGYRSIKELYQDCSEELAAQLITKGEDGQCKTLADSLGISFDDLTERAFPRIVAYGACSAVETRPRPDGSSPPSAELRLKKRFGDGKYKQLLTKTFPLVFACLWCAADDEQVDGEKLLEKNPQLVDARAYMMDILKGGFSQEKASTPKPHYKVKHVFGAMSNICSALDLNVYRAWSPNIFTFVARRVLEKLHPARGPINSLATMRIIRFLVSFAGPVAYEGYPLEMLLHGLKPYSTDEMCAVDTIGLMKYLFDKGEAYLSKRPTFVLGIFLSTVENSRGCRSFGASNGDITQEVPDSNMRSIAEDFEHWLGDYLETLKLEGVGDVQTKRFRLIVRLTRGLKDRGNAPCNSQESEFLGHILDDYQSKDRFLDDTSLRLVLRMLSPKLKRPDTSRNDMFETDSEDSGYIERADSLFQICQRLEVSDEFLQLSARVLGRSYATSGKLHQEWAQEVRFEHPTDITPESHLDTIPKVGILRAVKRLLLAEDPTVVTLAESALLRIICDNKEEEDDMTISQALTPKEIDALFLPVLPYPTEDQAAPQSLTCMEDSTLLAADRWVKRLAILFTTHLPGDPIVRNLEPLLAKVAGLAEELFPYILHILLCSISEDNAANNAAKGELSQLFQDCFQACCEKTVRHNAILIKSIMYLRTQKAALREGTQSGRDRWIGINYHSACRAACICKMYKTALLFAEIHDSGKKDKKDAIRPSLLLEIFKNVEDPDSYYGVTQSSGLRTVLDRFEYEGDGWNSLSFRGANLESLRRLGKDSTSEDIGVVSALNHLGLNGMSRSFLEASTNVLTASATPLDNHYSSAWKLEQWDLSCPPSCKNHSATIYRVLQSVNSTIDSRPISSYLDSPLLDVMKQITFDTQTSNSLTEGMRTLAMITEMEEALVSRKLEETCKKFRQRESWMHIARYPHVQEIMAMRQVTFGSLVKQKHLLAAAHTELPTAKIMEVNSLIGTCKMARSHKVLQHALSAATHLEELVSPCRDLNIHIEVVSALQSANVLWELGERVPAIRMLQNLETEFSNHSQTVGVSRPKLLAKLGTWIAEARLEQPDRILSSYLEPAITRLGKSKQGADAGAVFHAFASFCDAQLQDADNQEDFQRAQKLRETKEKEVNDLKQAMQNTPGKSSEMSRELAKAKKWLQIEAAEFERLNAHRNTFLEKAVLNFLLALQACDSYDGDAVRFCALWLKNSDHDGVNMAANALQNVPSRTFVPLMNQLSSRLFDSSDAFQQLLTALVTRICIDHPYHGIYQITALQKLENEDSSSKSRKGAAKKVMKRLTGDKKTRAIAFAIQNATGAYRRLAKIPVEKAAKKAGKQDFRELLRSERTRKGEVDLCKFFEQDIQRSELPPPTMHIALRTDCDYSRSNLPWIQKFDSTVHFASGVSIPKIVACRTNDGRRYKMLFKGGHDDLRQDAIMEQVFEQVSKLLQKSHTARQRELTVRTYKILPLTHDAGIMEFVPNTIPLTEYLTRAHASYRIKDLGWSDCRQKIHQAAGLKRNERIKEYQLVAQRFKPVLRYFFMHRFNGPDEWFASRLAYTRTTAAISMLGYVVGLGDRHGHNILLDEKTGEVIHIDLGVSFEQGRILPIPETVPFRLTRDIVDGMGITKTEGVFRRCCEFTLAVLRDESYSILTILDVLRYDPLYSWTISGQRIKKMMEEEPDAKASEDGSTQPVAKTTEDASMEAAEAQRALTGVERKLSKNLSVEATVNELIQQATDEKNLALLFCGWAAWV